MQESQPQNSTSIASLSVQQLQEMIANSIKTQYGGPAQTFSLYSKPYTKRIDNMRMPHGYQPPKFQQFDGKGNPKQHVAHFIETCETAGTRGDLLVKQFVRTLKGNAFDWYTDLEPESIDSWEQLERDFLNRFYSIRRIVSMIELTATKQRKGEPVIDYINRWRALSLDCKDRLTELSAVEMYTQGMHWGLMYILQGIKPCTFEELETRAHDMELSIANRGNNDLLVSEVRKEKKEVKSTQKVLKGATKEAMVVSTTPLKLVSKEKKIEKRQDEGEKRHPTLNERQEKIYPFPNSDLPDMLDQLLEKQLVQLPECKRPVEMGRVNDPNYCKYHRVISHPVEKCFVLKELILKLALDKKIELELDDVAQTNHAAVIIQSDSRLSAIGSLIQFGSLEPVVIYSSPEDLQNNDFRADSPKEEEKQVDNVEEGWTLVTRRKKRKQSFSQKESGSYRTYRSKSKSQRRNTRKNLRKFLPIIEESERLSRPRRSIILKDFFSKNFPMEIVSCHTTSTTEEDAFPLNAMKETPRPEDLLPLGINDLLTLSREVKDTIIEILKNDDVSTTVTSPTNVCDSCCMSISFSNEDLLLGSKLHNRPLYVSGYVRKQKLNQILIDNGSAVNILPKSTMNQLGISVEELSNSKLVIQGFNQGAQRAIGTVRWEIVIGDLQASTIFHVIDSRTTYKMLLGRPWIHENGIVTSTLHQCFTFYKQGIKKVDADSRPFTKAESHFADAKFYTKSEDVSEIISTEVPVTKSTFKNEQEMITSKKSNKGDALNSQQNGESTIETKLRAPEAEKIATLQKEVSNPPVLRYIPLSRHKKGESPSAECSKNLTIKNTEILKENFTAPLTKIEKGEAKKIEKKDLEAYLPERRTVDGKGGLELSPTQKKLQKQGYSIPNSRAGIEYQSSEPVRITDNELEDEVDVAGCCHVTIEEISDHDIFEEDVEAAPLSLEDGGQSTIDELKEVNLGTKEEPRPTFISTQLSDNDENEYVNLLKAYKDVFAWSYKEMSGLDPKVVVHRLAIKPEHRPVKQAQRRFRPELISQIEEEVNKLIEVGFIREVKYPTWIANIVPVRKKNGQLRVCVDFRDLNNACPKDDFPLPIMEIMIDATSGHEALSFMDGSSGYNQIRMALDDEEKTAFRTPKGKFLGFIVRHRGIEVNHSKIDAIQKMPSLKNLHELRRLQDQSCQNAFDGIKKYLLNPPVLSASTAGKPLILYIAAQETSLGALLAQENDKGKKCALYYLSRTLIGAELNYSPIEKMCLALFFAIDKLRHYMQAFTIHLVAKADPEKYILSRPVISGHLAKWAIILQQYDIVYIPQKAVKGQALADFLADHPVPPNWKLCDDLPDEEVLFVESMEPWIMFFDGAARRSGAGVGIVFISPEKHMLPYSFTLGELCSNNVAEYQAFIIGLQMASEFGIKCIKIFGNSKLIINQLSYQYEHIPRSENKKVDALTNLATALTVSEDIPINIFLCQKWIVPSIESQYEEADVISVYAIDEEDWRQPIIDYLKHGKLPTDPRHRAEIRKEESTKALEEVHSGICCAHQSGPKLQYQLKRMGYYWPIMIHDSMHFVKYCEACQFHANFIHQPLEPLHPTIASWPFEARGLDLVGPITPKSSAGHSYILAGTDYFSKWAEAVPLIEAKKENIVNFVQTHIIYRYGIPHRIVTDNERQFANTLMDKLCEKFNFKQYKSSMYNATANGLAEAFNKTLCSLLKKVVSKTKRDWQEKIGEALWAYRTTHRTPTGVTPYSLVYGVEAVLPLEREIHSLRMAIQEELTIKDNARLRLQELEALDENRLEAQHSNVINHECQKHLTNR
ncbi:uncharacterized protein E6C27_scaffold110G002330 [Cucumis melo var. makuwa]|uniref:RNA-directed DNA polymerase n=1 Tax=Cucumis melo var. makuwa TaxID=1194695 RepID=A0A5A7TJ44_CUCMM|nr:uncharacterized protein E6C27_scaffold110G002330 [Cucumis melo var. makuwa]